MAMATMPDATKLNFPIFKGFVTGHDFSRAENGNKFTSGFSPCKTRLKGKVLKGHGFSRAASRELVCWALAPEGTFLARWTDPFAHVIRGSTKTGKAEPSNLEPGKARGARMRGVYQTPSQSPESKIHCKRETVILSSL